VHFIGELQMKRLQSLFALHHGEVSGELSTQTSRNI